VGAKASARNREWSDVTQERRVSPIEGRVERLTREPVAVVNVVTVILCATTLSTLTSKPAVVGRIVTATVALICVLIVYDGWLP
jgi:hypothetical protein